MCLSAPCHPTPAPGDVQDTHGPSIGVLDTHPLYVAGTHCTCGSEWLFKDRTVPVVNCIVHNSTLKYTVVDYSLNSTL